MPKRKKRNPKLKKCSESLSDSSESSDILEFDHSYLAQVKLPIYNCSSLLQEIQEFITDIYREYLKDLKTRKEKRLKQKIPTSETQPYNLVISKSHLISLRSKIQDLIKNNYTCSLKNTIDDILDSFIMNLQEFLEESEDKSRLLQIVYLHEINHTLENSISEVSKILVEVYSFQEFAKVTLKKLYNNILSKQKKLIAFAKSQDTNHYAISGLLRLYSDIEIMNKTGEYQNDDLGNNYSSDIDDSIEEHVHSLPLDELINYINGSSFKQKGRSKIKMKKEAQCSALDLEIIEFENRLATELPSKTKAAPYCSHDFLKSLRERYLEVRKKLLNN